MPAPGLDIACSWNRIKQDSRSSSGELLFVDICWLFALPPCLVPPHPPPFFFFSQATDRICNYIAFHMLLLHIFTGSSRNSLAMITWLLFININTVFVFQMKVYYVPQIIFLFNWIGIIRIQKTYKISFE